jgi:hypothetical protein
MRYISLSVSLSRDRVDWKVREVIVYMCYISLSVCLSSDRVDWKVREVVVYVYTFCINLSVNFILDRVAFEGCQTTGHCERIPNR